MRRGRRVQGGGNGQRVFTSRKSILLGGQCGSEILHRLKAAIRVLGERTVDDRAKTAWACRDKRAKAGRQNRNVLTYQLRVVPLKRRAFCKKLKENDTQGVDVCAPIDIRSPFALFR